MRTATMTRRRMLLFGLLATVTGIGLGAWMLSPRPPSTITRVSAAKITEGMTLAEVEAILGGPERDDTTGPVVSDFVGPDGMDQYEERLAQFRSVHSPRVWSSDHVWVLVQIDADGRVAWCISYHQRRQMQESPLDTLRRWLRL
jgi:hypothetical protein